MAETAVEKLVGINALGNIRQVASQARPKSAPAAEGLTNAQDQIDKLLRLTQDAVVEISASIPAPTDVVVDTDGVILYED